MNELVEFGGFRKMPEDENERFRLEAEDGCEITDREQWLTRRSLDSDQSATTAAAATPTATRTMTRRTTLLVAQ